MQLSNGQNYRNLRYTLALPAMGVPYLAEIEEHFHRACQRHVHEETQVLVLLEGALRVEGYDREVVARAGDACVIPPRLSHFVGAAAKDPKVVYLDLRVNVNSGPVAAFVQGDELAVRPGDVSAVQTAVRQVAKAAGSVTAGRSARVMSAVWLVLAELTGESSAGDETGESDRRLGACERYMKERLSHEISVDDLAALSGLSRSQLSRLYVRHFNQSPAARLRQLRIEQAKHLLHYSTLSVKEVARVCGFVCANHFSRVYHHATGSSPTAGRRGSA